VIGIALGRRRRRRERSFASSCRLADHRLRAAANMSWALDLPDGAEQLIVDEALRR
jgi:hypothetical protein